MSRVFVLVNSIQLACVFCCVAIATVAGRCLGPQGSATVLEELAIAFRKTRSDPDDPWEVIR